MDTLSDVSKELIESRIPPRNSFAKPGKLFKEVETGSVNGRLVLDLRRACNIKYTSIRYETFHKSRLRIIAMFRRGKTHSQLMVSWDPPTKIARC